MIFTTQEKQLAIFGNSLDSIKGKLISLSNAFETGGIKGNGGILDVLSSKKSTILNPDTLKDFDRFKDAFNNSAKSAEVLSEELKITDQSIVKYASTCKNGQMTTAGFQASLKSTGVAAKIASVGLKLFAIAGNMVAGMLIAFAIGKVIQAMDDYIHRIDNAKEALEDSVSEYQNIRNEVSDLEDELKDCTDRLNELQKLADNGTISIVEEEELQTLKETNDELERRLALKQAEEIEAQKQILSDNEELLNQKIRSKYETEVVGGSNPTEVSKDVSLAEEYVNSINAYKFLESSLKNGEITQDEFDKRSESIDDDIQKYAEILNTSADAYDELIRNGVTLQGEDLEEYNHLKDLQDEYLMYTFRVNGLTSAYKTLNDEKQKTMATYKLEKQGLSETDAQAVVDEMSSDELDSFGDVQFTFTEPDRSAYDDAKEYGRAYIDAMMEGVEEEQAEIVEIVSFAKAFRTLKDDARTAFTDMASAGKLTVDAFMGLDGADDLMASTGLSAEELTKKINKMATSADQLSSMSDDISKMSEALTEKGENGSASVDTLAGISTEVKGLESWKEFELTLGSTSSTMAECKSAASKLATEWVNSNNFLALLNNTNKDYYKTQLDAMGVENSQELVEKSLAKKKLELAIANGTLTDATGELTEKAKEEAETLGLLPNTLEALQKCYSDAQEVMSTAMRNGVTERLKNLGIELEGIKSAQEAYEAMANLNNVSKKNQESYINGKYVQTEDGGWTRRTKNTSATDENSALNALAVVYEGADKELKEYLTKIKANIKPTDTDSGSGSKSSSSSSAKKESTQIIDWIARRLDVLNSKLDLTKSKYENLFTVSDKNSNLKKQIDTQTKLLNTYEKAVSKYTKKADSVKLSDDLKEKVRNGQIKGSPSQLIKTYGEKTANRIQTYQDYYDQAQSARNSAESTRSDILSTRIERYQNRVDAADSKTEKYDAQIDNATSAKERSKLEKERRNELIKSYNNQIKIAKLEKDSVKVATLKEQKEQAITESKIQQHQYYVDEYDSQLALYDAEMDILSTANEKNAIEEKRQKSIAKSYAHQIKIAELESDETEVLKLKAELEREILDSKIQQHQNLADEADANIALYELMSSNANSSDEKNKYEELALDNIIKQNRELTSVAILNGDITEQLRLQEELAQSISAAYKAMFDNIADEYEAIINFNSQIESKANAMIAYAQEIGETVNKSLYGAMIANTVDEIALLNEEREKLVSEMSGAEYLSSDWYDIQSKLQEIDEQIIQNNTDIATWIKTMNEMDLQKFDDVIARLDELNSESEFLINMFSYEDLFDSDTGNITDGGLATLTLYLNKMEIASSKLKELQAARAEFQKQVESNVDYMSDADVAAKFATYDESIRQAIISNKELEKSIVSLVENGLNSQIDALTELVNKRKEALSAEKSLYDYQKKVAEQTKNIVAIQRQMAALMGDRSEETVAKLQNLQIDLDDAKSNLEDTEYDKYISDQQEMLDSMLDDLKDFVETALLDTDAIIDAVREAVIINGSMIYDAIMGVSDSSGYDLSSYMDDMIASLNTISGNLDMTNLGDTFTVGTSEVKNAITSMSSTVTDLLGQIQSSVYESLNQSNVSIVEQSDGTSTRTYTTDDGRIASAKYDSNNNLLSTKYYSADGKEYYGAKNTTLGKLMELIEDSSNLVRSIPNNAMEARIYNKTGGYLLTSAAMKKFNSIMGFYSGVDPFQKAESLEKIGFAKGGVVGGASYSGDNLVARVNSRESIMTADFTNLLPESLKRMDEFVNIPNFDASSLGNLKGGSNISVGDVQIVLDGSDVTDAESMVKAIKESPALQRTIQNATIGQIEKSFNNRLKI